jgi:hypothetical protein
MIKNKDKSAVFLNALQMQVSLPNNVVYTDLGKINDHNFNEDGEFGTIIYAVDQETREFNLFVRTKASLTEYKSIFAAGHEEGHALHIMGRLGDLYREAKQYGLSFDFLTEKDASRYDRMACANLASDTPTTSSHKMLEESPKENIAHVGGLVALIKSGIDIEIVKAMGELMMEDSQ